MRNRSKQYKSLKKNDSVPKKVERSGEREFRVHHDDGSVFEGKVDTPERFHAFKNLKSFGKIFSFGGIGKGKPLICDSCKERVYKVIYQDGKCICEKCK